jgi:hypothetical protein
MSSDRTRTRASVAGALVALATTVVAGGVVAQSPAPSSFGDLDPDAIVLTGRIVGSNAGLWEELPPTDHATQVTMDVTMTLEPDRAFIEGTAMVSGSYSGDCQFAHEEAVAILSDSNDPTLRPPIDPTSTRPAFATVGVYTTDPRFPERPLEGFYLSAGAGTGTSGGICGYLTGRTYPITDVDFALTIDVIGCSFFEVLAAGDGYAGTCSETDAGSGRMAIEWSAAFEQLHP